MHSLDLAILVFRGHTGSFISNVLQFRFNILFLLIKELEALVGGFIGRAFPANARRLAGNDGANDFRFPIPAGFLALEA